MKISFVTTCMGRLHHLRKTFLRNLRDNKDWPELEFVILDYNSRDGLERWARSVLLPHIRRGRVIYGRERAAGRFIHAHAKNVAHLLATGDVLVNLDADNYAGIGYAWWLARLFSRRGRNLVVTSGIGSLCGRIALSRENFLRLRGYDEDLRYGWGYEDVDLVLRARNLGLEHLELKVEGMGAIAHPDRERGPAPRMSRALHVEIVQARRGRVVNRGKTWGAAAVSVNFDRRFISIGAPRPPALSALLSGTGTQGSPRRNNSRSAGSRLGP